MPQVLKQQPVSPPAEVTCRGHMHVAKKVVHAELVTLDMRRWCT